MAWVQEDGDTSVVEQPPCGPVQSGHSSEVKITSPANGLEVRRETEESKMTWKPSLE